MAFPRLKFLMALLAFGLGTGCAVYLPKTPVQPPPGFIFEQVRAPLTTDFEATVAHPPKSGSATNRFFCLFYRPLSIAWEPCGIEDAARNGNIQKVEYAEYEFLNVLGIYQEFTVHAYGY